jgi:hypothetical protein
MLKIAIEYRMAVDALTSNKANKLRMCEMTDDEWELATQLSDVLKVLTIRTPMYALVNRSFAGPQRRHSHLLSTDSKSRQCDTSDGSHRSCIRNAVDSTQQISFRDLRCTSLRKTYHESVLWSNRYVECV